MQVSIIHNRREQPQKSPFIEVHFSEVEQIADAVLTHVKIIDTLDYVENPENLIATAIAKMRYGATLTIVATDIFSLADKIVNGASNIDEVRKLIYGGRKSISNVEHVKRLIEQYRLVVDLVNLDRASNQYMIIARKPTL